MNAVDLARVAAGEHLMLAQGVDGRIVVRGTHQAWLSAGLDPRDFLADGPRGAVARVFADELGRICGAMVTAVLGRAA